MMADSGGSYGRIESIDSPYRGEQKVSFSTEESLMIPSLLVLKHKLVVGTIITVAQYAQLKRESDETHTKEYAERYLALRMYGTDELRARLREKGCGSEAIGMVIADLTKRRLLDDEAYAFALVRRTLERKPAGEQFLIAVLRKKRLNQQLATTVVQTALLSEDESSLAIRALEKRWRLWANLDLESIRKKAYTYLSGRGIGYAAAKEAVDLLARRQSDEQ